jgi:hypothetical protein
MRSVILDKSGESHQLHGENSLFSLLPVPAGPDTEFSSHQTSGILICGTAGTIHIFLDESIERSLYDTLCILQYVQMDRVMFT